MSDAVTLTLTDRHEAVLDLISRYGRGRGCALGARAICELCMERYAVRLDTRQVGQIVAELVEAGYCIAGSSRGGRLAGYFIPQSMAEVREVDRELTSRALNTLRRRRALRQAAEGRFVAQPTLKLGS